MPLDDSELSVGPEPGQHESEPNSDNIPNNTDTMVEVPIAQDNDDSGVEIEDETNDSGLLKCESTVNDYHPSSPWDCTEPIHIRDGTLERAIRITTGKLDGPLGQRDVNALTSLTNWLQTPVDEDFDWLGPVDRLDGIQCFVHLESLDLIMGTRRPMLEPLAYLQELRSLTLETGYVGLTPVDYTPLTSLNKLNRLVLPNQRIASVEFVRFLSNLKWLGLSGNEIDNIDRLSCINDLVEIDISSNHISDLAPLAQLPNVNKIYAADNQIRTLRPFVDARTWGIEHTLSVESNPLDCEAEAENIRTLRKRGVLLFTDCDPPPCPACPDIED